MIDVDYPLPELKMEEPNEVESSIGKLIAENLVADGATLQMGKRTYVATEYSHRVYITPQSHRGLTK
jgi:hypothetical protein